jgi:molybdopterin-binding protein
VAEAPQNEYVRIEVALDGGQILSALVTAASATDLERAMGASANSTLALEAQDGIVHVVVPRVMYMKRFAREGRVGFGN